MKVVVGLGNPGPEYDATRHNVGWWVLDRLAYDLEAPPFERDGPALTTRAEFDSTALLLVKPRTYMNRSGRALRLLAELDDFDPSTDLLVVVDDATREVGQVRFRTSGGAGGHNGLKSIATVLGDEYPRLRIGVGRRPEGVEMTDWVLGEFDEEDEQVLVDLLPELSKAVTDWATLEFDEVMDRYNR